MSSSVLYKKMENQNLKTIPGVGTKIAQELIDLGFTKVSDLKNKNPEKIYKELCTIRKRSIDPCVLYVFRCAVYFASNTGGRKRDTPLFLPLTYVMSSVYV